MVLLWSVAFLPGCAEDSPPPAAKVRIGERTWTVELATTRRQRHKGLSGRTQLADDRGMLFVFAQAKLPTFVMRDCLIPIDLIFIGPDQRVVYTHEMKPEPGGAENVRYESVRPALYALELAGGQIQQAGIRAGDRVELIDVPAPTDVQSD